MDEPNMHSMEHNKNISVNIGFIGAGNMASAIGGGLIKSGIIKPSQIYVSAPSTDLFHLWENLGANTTKSNDEVVNKCPIVILAVKPQHVKEALSSAYKYFDKCPFDFVSIVSIVVGLSYTNIREMLFDIIPLAKHENKAINIVRTMPNTPLLVGEGVTVCYFPDIYSESPRCSVFQEHKKMVKNIFSTIGICEEVDENLINPIGALSGSGPAYVYQIIEAFSDGMVKLGVPRNMSYKIVSQTLIGAAKMVLETGKHPSQLKDEVCSPGGTTIAGISAMERNGVRFGLIDAIESAYNRSEEIAKSQNQP